MIRIGLIQFPGSNCERETALAVKRASMTPIEFLWNEPLEKLSSMDGYILVGGFSYEDRSRAGIIAALDPVIQTLRVESAKGKPLLGICNGAQILVEAGLVPGLDNNNLPMALTENKRIVDGKIVATGFYNTWVNLCLTANPKNNAFTRHLSPNNPLYLPIAHAEGRFLLPEQLLIELEKQGLIPLRYCDGEAKIVDNFPINPNGSVSNIAAITNKAGNVMAIMPHPERTSNGDPIFTSMRAYISEAYHKELSFSTPPSIRYPKPLIRKKIPGSHLCLVKLIITDNQALTVQKTLRRLGFPVTVTRCEHWEIVCDSKEIVEFIKKTGLLYSERKEREVSISEGWALDQQSLSYLVRAKEDLKGRQALQTLEAHYAVSQVKNIDHGVVWQFSSDQVNISDLIDNILLTNIIGNQYAHEYYHYDYALWQ
jgi:phosphoribosylformylglycinamidine synthase subunit PurQ / glutaminase